MWYAMPHLTEGLVFHPKTCKFESEKKKKKETSRVHENDRATIKKRYCGHVYSPLLHKRTHLDHREWVSYYVGEG
jgi:hypothetical protein